MRECNSWMRDAFDYILLEKSSSALFWTVMTWGSRGWSWLSCWWGSSCPSSPPLGCNSQERTVFLRQLRADQAFPEMEKSKNCCDIIVYDVKLLNFYCWYISYLFLQHIKIYIEIQEANLWPTVPIYFTDLLGKQWAETLDL